MTYKYLLVSPQRKIDSVLNKTFFLRNADRLAVRNSIRAQKNSNRIAKIKETTHKRLWGELLIHLKYEMSNAKVGLAYVNKNPTPERVAAFEAYIGVMNNLALKMQKQRVGLQYTPSQIAKERGLPNNGGHWTDWVSADKKHTIAEMFAEIPHQPKAKRKAPFPRTLRPDKNVDSQGRTAAQRRLLDRTERQLQLELVKHSVEFTDVRDKRIKRMQTAIRLIKELKPTDYVPTTWNGLFAEYK